MDQPGAVPVHSRNEHRQLQLYEQAGKLYAACYSVCSMAKQRLEQVCGRGGGWWVAGWRAWAIWQGKESGSHSRHPAGGRIRDLARDSGQD